MATSMLYTYIFIYLSCISFNTSVYRTCIGDRKNIPDINILKVYVINENYL